MTFTHTRAEVVAKPDGRYLLYYSWPGLDDDEAGASSSPDGSSPATGARGPDQKPWSPQGGPPDE